jgi:hypothetical protein
MLKNIVQSDRPQMTKQCGACALYAGRIRPEYRHSLVRGNTASPRQKRLHAKTPQCCVIRTLLPLVRWCIHYVVLRQVRSLFHSVFATQWDLVASSFNLQYQVFGASGSLGCVYKDWNLVVYDATLLINRNQSLREMSYPFLRYKHTEAAELATGS